MKLEGHRWIVVKNILIYFIWLFVYLFIYTNKYHHHQSHEDCQETKDWCGGGFGWWGGSGWGVCGRWVGGRGCVWCFGWSAGVGWCCGAWSGGGWGCCGWSGGGGSGWGAREQWTVNTISSTRCIKCTILCWCWISCTVCSLWSTRCSWVWNIYARLCRYFGYISICYTLTKHFWIKTLSSCLAWACCWGSNRPTSAWQPLAQRSHTIWLKKLYATHTAHLLWACDAN